MEETFRQIRDRVLPTIKWENEFRSSQIRRWLRDDNFKLCSKESGMTKDVPYPEEVKERFWKKLQEELDKQTDDQYCDCHTRCPKCGRRYRRPAYHVDVKE